MRIILVAAVLTLAACNRDRPPAPTREQAAQLNEMENDLNDLAQNEEGPANRSAGPSNSSD